MNARTLGWAFAVLLVPAAGRAYVRTAVDEAHPDSCLFWSARTVPWSPAERLGGDLPEAEALDAFRASFAEWASQSCTDLAFAERAPVEREVGYRSGATNDNVLLFRDVACADVVPAGDPCFADDDCANVYDCWAWDDSLIAVTTTTFSQCSGRIVDADIEFNASAFRFTTVDGAACTSDAQRGCVSTDLRNTLVHEIGHVIGLDHSPVRSATMFASAPPGEIQKRSLGQDDLEGLCDIYPAGAPTLVCEPPTPANRCNDGADSAAVRTAGCSSAGGLAPWALVPVWFWRRRRSFR